MSAHLAVCLCGVSHYGIGRRAGWVGAQGESTSGGGHRNQGTGYRTSHFRTFWHKTVTLGHTGHPLVVYPSKMWSKVVTAIRAPTTTQYHNHHQWMAPRRSVPRAVAEGGTCDVGC